MSTILQTGYKLPQAVISNGEVTGNAWSNPDNILLVDGEFAGSDTSGAASDIIVGNFNFNLPETSVITGIQFKVIGYAAAITSPLTTLTPSAVDNTSGQNLYYPYVTPFDGFTTSVATYVFGTSSYLFATSWTVNQINNFKLQLTANNSMFIDSVLVNVFYYDGSSPEPDPVESGLCVSCESQIQAQPFFLALPVSPTDTGIYLKSFNLPNGIPITMSNVGECGGTIPIVLDQGKPAGNGEPFEENAKVINVVSQPNGTVFLDFGTLNNRGLGFVQPYTHDDDNISEHNANSEVVISNSGVFYDKFLKKCQIDVLVSGPIQVDDEGNPITTSLHEMDFRGAGVVAFVDPDDSHKVIVTIAGGGGTTPPQINNTSSTTSGSEQVDSIDWEHTCDGINRGLLVQVSMEEGTTIDTIKYNGDSLTQLVSETDAGSNLRQEQWFLLAPSVGTYSIVITLIAPSYISAGAESFVGIDQTTPTGSTETAKDSDNNPTLDLITTYDNSIVVDGLATAITPILYTPGAGQSENWHETANADTRQGGSSAESAGSQPDTVTMDWSITQSTDWVLTAVEIKGITSSGGSSGGDVDLTVIQPGHGFTQGDVLKSAGTDGVYSRALADNSVDAEVVGIVKTVVDTDTFILSKDAYYSGIGIPAGTPGEAVFLSPTTPGAMTGTAPSTTGQVIKPLGVLHSSGDLMGFTADIRGNVIANPSPGSGLEVQEGGVQVDPDASVMNFTGSGVSVTQTSPGVVEVNITGGDGPTALVSEQNVGGWESNLHTDPAVLHTQPGMTSSVDGDVIFIRGFGSNGGTASIPLRRYQKDPNSGLFYLSHRGNGDFGSSGTINELNGGLVQLGIYIYSFWNSPNQVPTGHHGARYLAADLTGGVSLTFNDGNAGIDPCAFTDGTFIYLGNSPVKKYSISGTALSFVANISGGSETVISAIYDPDTTHVFFIEPDFTVSEYSIGASTLTLIDTFKYNLPSLGGIVGNMSVNSTESVYPTGMVILGSSSNMFYVGYRSTSKISGQGNPIPTVSSDTTILKAFTKPSEL